MIGTDAAPEGAAFARDHSSGQVAQKIDLLFVQGAENADYGHFHQKGT